MIHIAIRFTVRAMICGAANPNRNIYPEYDLTTEDIREVFRASGLVPDIRDCGEKYSSGCFFEALYGGDELPATVHSALVSGIYSRINEKGVKRAVFGDLRISTNWYPVEAEYTFTS